MQLLFFISGATLVAVALLDAFISTLSARGAGPVSGPVTKTIWRGVMVLHRKGPAHRLLQVVGVAMLIVVAGLWIAMLWAGWTLIFSSVDGAVISTNARLPATIAERIYFVGYTVFTLGNGEYQPDGTVAQVGTVLASLSGLFLVTLAITYLIPIVDAVVAMRQMDVSVQGIGETPMGILLTAWDGKSFSGLEQDLRSLAAAITLYGQRHLAYPLIHYYHELERGKSPALRIAALDEALTLLESGIEPAARPSRLALSTIRTAIASYLEAVEYLYDYPAGETPAPPVLEPLRQAGLPVVSNAAFHEALSDLDTRRRRLKAAVISSGWSWEDVSASSSSEG